MQEEVHFALKKCVPQLHSNPYLGYIKQMDQNERREFTLILFFKLSALANCMSINRGIKNFEAGKILSVFSSGIQLLTGAWKQILKIITWVLPGLSWNCQLSYLNMEHRFQRWLAHNSLIVVLCDIQLLTQHMLAAAQSITLSYVSTCGMWAAPLISVALLVFEVWPIINYICCIRTHHGSRSDS